MTNTEIKDYREFKTLEEKQTFLENLQLKPLEDFIKDQFDLRVKFKKTIYVRKEINQVQMHLESNDIKRSTGALKSLFNRVILATFGSISFHTVVKPSVGCDAEFSELSFPDISLIYECKDNGNDQRGIIYVTYDLNNRNWYFKSCKDNYTMNYAYDGTYRPYEEKYEQDRPVEIKEV